MRLEIILSVNKELLLANNVYVGIKSDCSPGA